MLAKSLHRNMRLLYKVKLSSPQQRGIKSLYIHHVNNYIDVRISQDEYFSEEFLNRMIEAKVAEKSHQWEDEEFYEKLQGKQQEKQNKLRKIEMQSDKDIGDIAIKFLTEGIRFAHIPSTKIESNSVYFVPREEIENDTSAEENSSDNDEKPKSAKTTSRQTKSRSDGRSIQIPVITKTKV